MSGAQFRRALLPVLFASACCLGACRGDQRPAHELRVPRGYMSTLRVETSDGILSFGPFVGYYFAPETPSDLTRLRMVCFNERSFYTRDLPVNARLFVGEARFAVLPDADFTISTADRINPVFFSEAPPVWPASRPHPQDEFVHFHSCYNDSGFSAAGYWIRHVGVAEFTYDMGGRVSPPSPLFHLVEPGPDKEFARIIEFDRGPRGGGLQPRRHP